MSAGTVRKLTQEEKEARERSFVEFLSRQRNTEQRKKKKIDEVIYNALLCVGNMGIWTYFLFLLSSAPFIDYPELYPKT